MKPVFTAARKASASTGRVVFAEGEEERVLRAAQIIVDERLAQPILIGRPEVIEERIQRYGLRLKAGVHITIVNPQHDDRYHQYWTEYHALMARHGVTAQYAKLEMRRRMKRCASASCRRPRSKARRTCW
nr:phosphate acyltransferase [Nevskia sp.]